MLKAEDGGFEDKMEDRSGIETSERKGRNRHEGEKESGKENKDDGDRDRK